MNQVILLSYRYLCDSKSSNQSLPHTAGTLIGRANVANVGVSNGVGFVVVASVGGHTLWEQVRG